MKKIKNIFIIVLLAIVATSCGTVTRMNTLSPDRVELQINMNDLEYLGETEVSVAYDKYVGIFTSINEINGEVYNPAEVQVVNLEGLNFSLEKHLNKATYKVIEDFPQATYYQVIYKKKTKDRLFLGSTVKISAVIRAYSFK